MLHYSYKTGEGLSSTQKAYAQQRSSLRAADMARTVKVLLVPDAGKSVMDSDEGETIIVPAAEMAMEVVYDVPRHGRTANRRVHQLGRPAVSAAPETPWLASIGFESGSVRPAADLVAGVATLVQQSETVVTDDPILSPRDGMVSLSNRDGMIYVSVGMFAAGNEQRPLLVASFPAKELPGLRVANCRVDRVPPGRLFRVGRTTAGSVLLSFSKETQLRVAKFGLDKQPLMQPNSPYAVPAEDAATLYGRSYRMTRTAERLPLADADGFSVFQAAYVEEIEQGLTGTNWSRLHVARAGAGRLAGFAEIAPVLFPRDAVVVAVREDGRRLIATLDDGSELDVPAKADIQISCRAYSAFEPIGRWCTPSGKVLPPETRLTDSDLLAILFSIAQQQGIVRQLGEHPVLFAPHGTLGSLAIEDPQSLTGTATYFGFRRHLWQPELGGFLLPAVGYSQVAEVGSVLFDVVRGAAMPERLAGDRQVPTRAYGRKAVTRS